MEKFLKFSRDSSGFMGPKAQRRGGYSPTSMLIYPRRPFLGRSRGGGWRGLRGVRVEGDGRMMERAGCGERERQSGDGK